MITDSKLTEKYRPRNLVDLIGQKIAVQQVQGMIKNNRIHNCILITGPSGTGKTSLAYIIAYLINERKYGKSLPDLQNHDMANSNIDMVREIIASANYAPNRNFRVLILDEVQKLSAQSQQALLKPMEESPKQTVWILVTNEPQKLSHTILRRCYQLNLVTPTLTETKNLLTKIAVKEQIKFPKANKLLTNIARAANHEPSTAIQMLQGAADAYIIGGSYEELLKAAYKANPTLANDTVAAKLLIYIYLGKIDLMLTTLNDINDYIPVANALLNFNAWLLTNKYKVKSWWSPMTNKLSEYITNPKVKDILHHQEVFINLRKDLLFSPGFERHVIANKLSKLALRHYR